MHRSSTYVYRQYQDYNKRQQRQSKQQQQQLERAENERKTLRAIVFFDKDLSSSMRAGQ